jgi:hypothetical protein
MTATRTRLIARDAGDWLPRRDRISDLEQELLDLTGDRRWNLGVDLVRVRLHQRFALVHVLAPLLVPGADGYLLGSLQLRHDNVADLGAHETILYQAIDTTSSSSSSQ